MPCCDPKALKPQKMRVHNEVCKGLRGFLNIWNAIANDDFSGKFRQKNEHVSQYWRGMKVAFTSIKVTLRDGFWPRSKFTPSEADQFQVDGTL